MCNRKPEGCTHCGKRFGQSLWRKLWAGCGCNLDHGTKVGRRHSRRDDLLLSLLEAAALCQCQVVLVLFSPCRFGLFKLGCFFLEVLLMLFLVFLVSSANFWSL